MISSQLVAPKQFEFTEEPTPEPGPGEVLLRVGSVAICGSEHAPYLGIATEYPMYKHVVKYPRAVGHEASGVIERLGPGVTGFKVGQAVVPPEARFATHSIAKASELVAVPEGVSLQHCIFGVHGGGNLLPDA